MLERRLNCGNLGSADSSTPALSVRKISDKASCVICIMKDAEFDLAIVGAGIVGVSCALWAQKLGLRVLILDENQPGTGVSMGNAGTIATYACVPVNSPGIFRSLPSLLFSRESPLGFDWLYAMRNMPWVLAFLRNCTPANVRRISDQLGDLLSYTDSGLDPLIAEAGAEDLLIDNGCLYIYSTKTSFEAAAISTETRRRNGVVFDVLDVEAVRELEPTLKLSLYKGLHYRGARHVSDPQALVERFHERFTKLGGTWLQKKVVRTNPDMDFGVEVELADGARISTRRAVVAAGAHSKSIADSGVSDLPLDTERGHHVVFNDQAHLLSRPVGWADAGLYATPMKQGLRIAGTVEIAGLKKPKSQARIDFLTRKAHEMFGDLGAPDEDWLGFRPTMPDALPVIGRSHRSDKILFAFGHQHIGLTLAGITGRIIADLAQDRMPNFDISGFDPKRFTGF